ncbi:MAG: hypothetical protein SFY81_08785 [Verrucomicrobiota bacterium]|nr:hypothetical protein [Verrucomicrobiota bacterium]
MNEKKRKPTLIELQARKALLVTQCAVQREQLASSCREMGRPVRTGFRMMRLFKSPLVLAGLGFLVLKAPWRKFFSLSSLLWKGWRLIRFVRAYR